MNIDEIKDLVKQSNEFKSVDDILALCKANDPFYIQANSKEKAEWFKDIWEKEKAISNWEDGRIHPRGLHYQILGRDYYIKINGKKIKYANTEQCWHYLEKGAKYSRLLGLVPYESIKDEKNPKPENVPAFYIHEGFEVKDVYVTDDFYKIRLPYLMFDNLDDLIAERVEDIIEELFEGVIYHSLTEQPNYFEIWAEKKGVIPKDVAREFSATVRPSGSGEFSIGMCFHAVKRAKDSGKNLHIFILSDFDPKGMDMPKSVGRKVEFIAKELSINAFVHHVALTKEQCVRYSLPTVPAKNPKGENKGYIKHAKIFKEFAGQDPTEINSFLSREHIAYRNVIREAIEPYFDRDLDNKFKEEISKLKESIAVKLNKKFGELRENLIEMREEIKERIERFNSEIQPLVERRVKKLKLDLFVEEYCEILNFDVSEVLNDEVFRFPKVKVDTPKNALLDTRRSYLEQIAKYKEFDMRNNKKSKGD